MKELWKTLRLAFYVVVLPILATATLAADRLFQTTDETQEEIIPIKATTATFHASSQRSHSFMRDVNGTLHGRVTRFDVASGMSVANPNAHVVFMRNNVAVHSVMTNEEGMFSTNELLPGPYSVVATSKDGFATFGAYVVNSDLETTPTVEIATVASGSSKVHEVLSKPGGAAATIEAMAKLFNIDLAAMKINEPDFSAPSSEMVSGANRVKLTPDGNLQVRAYPLIWTPDTVVQFTNSTAYLIQNNQVVNQLPVGTDGRVLFRNVSPGQYDLVVKSEFGILAVGLEVVGPVNTDAGDSDTVPMAAMQDEPSDEAGVVLAEEGQGTEETQTIIREFYFTEAGAPAGGFGAGGVGGVGGGLGGLLETAIGAWLLSEIIDRIDDNDFNQNPPIVQQPVIIEPPPVSPAN